MPLTPIRLGYLPLIDAAPLIVAQELGFASEEGLSLDLIRLNSWAQSRDMLGAGLIEAAHMLAPMPVAQAMGLGPALPPSDLVMVLSQGGQAIAVSPELAEALRLGGHDFAFSDAMAAGRALRAAVNKPLRIGVPFLFSTQHELVRHWLHHSGFGDDISVVTVPPPNMAEAMAAGEVDLFCVGEPWASFAVENGIASLILPGIAIWAAPPEKGLVLNHTFVEGQPDLTGRLMRAIWRAGRWLDMPEHRGSAAEILSRPEYLKLPSELAERGLTGRMMVSPMGEMRDAPGFIAFNAGSASYPWRSLAAFFADRIARRHGRDPVEAMRRAMAVYRTDLYRQHLREAGAELPGASARLEGALATDLHVPAERGQMILRRDAFFDGTTFEPPFAI
ncbi:ABC transporter substrate-binding protein [Paracoccus sp. PAR01]|uniref:ABC transporter substrate-binding protein n=1 Tax=Paracoccus sp. PAR01 TaxID=2769282 RepID=UPI00177EA9F4|nr:ABC transporter substrate-binding protein [Paracoccus sp. PAR01]MBD9528804.1 ABC transporter substrate-binding protein [Paracoccus sp. PAR01]